MKHCLLALAYQGQYISIPHYYQEPGELCTVLNNKHCSISAAKKLITSGNISFYDGTSLCQFRSPESSTWSNKSLHAHRSNTLLIEHALNVKATHIICFEDGCWNEIPLYEIELQLLSV